MTGGAPLMQARAIATATPVALLGGALAFQFWGGLFPCEMCWWQRYALIAALVAALISWLRPADARLVALSGLALAASALLGGFHAGVEYHWWPGPAACTTAVSFAHGGDPLAAIMAAPNIRCDQAQWTLFGISLAGFNLLISGIAGLAVFTLLRRPAT